MKFSAFFIASFLLLSTSVLAQKNTSPKEENIVGGVVADANEFPWQVAIIDNSRGNNFDGQFCAGTIINSEWILTAAHCMKEVTDISKLRILVGTNSLTDGSGQEIEVHWTAVHEGFLNDGFAIHNDIALLKLKTPIDLSVANVSAIPWTTADDVANGLTATGIMATINGWGDTTNLRGNYSEVLRKAQVPIVSIEAANQSDAYNGRIKSYMLAAGYKEGGVDACAADSGGGLVVSNQNNDGWLLAGMVSWGVGCAEANKYGIYTRVSEFDAWIQEQMLVSAIGDDKITANKITFYPNPVADWLSIKWEKPLKTTKVNVIVYNTIGKMMYQKKFNTKGEQSISFAVNGFQKGVYLLQLSFDKQTTYRKVVVE